MGFKDKLRQNVIFYVARDGKLKLLEFLASERVGVAEVDTHGQIPLFYAAREGHSEMCRSLVQNGTDPNHADVVKQTCLFYSAKSGHLETCKVLIECGARHTHTDKKKQTALFWAKKSENPQLVEYFESLRNQKPTTAAAPVVTKEKTVSESKSNKKKKSKEDQKYTYHLVYTDENGHKIQMTKAEIQKFLESNPQLAEYFQHPEKLQTEGLERESWEKVAKKIIQAMWKIRGAYHFHTPVDPVRLSCLDYFDVIKNPMDFGTVKVRIWGIFVEE